MEGHLPNFVPGLNRLEGYEHDRMVRMPTLQHGTVRLLDLKLVVSVAVREVADNQ
jgi:hypothetical protein